MKRWLCLVGFAVGLLGCPVDNGGTVVRPCAPGAPRACACSAGGTGTQYCNTAGSGYGACGSCSQVCTPGALQACQCPDGSQNNQTCNAAGTAYGGCMCPSGCVPNCNDRECGGNGCPGGGQCGSCGAGESCDPSAGVCLPPVPDAGTPRDAPPIDRPVRDCTNRECGFDGAGGSCGTCPLTGWTCNGVGRCVAPDRVCVSACGGRQCGPDPGMYCEGRYCGPSPIGLCSGSSVCTSAGACVCTPQCTGRVCGDNGCGGQCGSCPIGSTCTLFGTCSAATSCTTACGGARVCGPDPGPGCTGTCGMCGGGTVCNASGTGCVVSTSSRWYVTVTNGTVGANPMGGGSWDVDGSPPDPYVCFTMNGVQSCTRFVADTYTPRWTAMNQFPATTAGALMAGVPMLYADDDLTTDNTICTGNVTFAADRFVAGTATITCAPYGTISVTLTPAP